MIKGILFDKDGTLLDFNRTWLPAYRQAAEFIATRVGRPELAYSLLAEGGYIAENGGWVSDSLLASGSNEQILDFWAGQVGSLDAGQLTGVREIFSHAGHNPVAVLDDMGGFFTALKNRQLVLGVATMDDEHHAHTTLKRLGIDHVFDFVCGADSGFGVKPEPGMIEGFAAHCRLQAAEVVMVGDSPRDLNMGRNAAAAMVVGVLTGAHDRGALAPLADYVLTDISGLLDILEL